MKSYVSQVIERQPTLLLSTKPNPKDYKTPAPGADALKTSIYATANLDLNFAQTAVALAYDASKRQGKCPTPLQAAWQALGRSFANDGGFKGQEPLQEVRRSHAAVLTTDAFESVVDLLRHQRPVEPQ